MVGEPMGHKYQGGKSTTLKNVDMKIDGDILTLTINLARPIGPSRSGYSELIASTCGTYELGTPGNEVMSLNIYRVLFGKGDLNNLVRVRTAEKKVMKAKESLELAVKRAEIIKAKAPNVPK